ncbi:MAG: hypothetical protein K9J30_11335 [Bacteroidales bacterium]|nr:hypothetical protein [Bacteroidales bacterium]
MKKGIILSIVIAGMAFGCSNVDVPEPQIYTFTAEPTSLPKRDTVKFNIDAEGDFIIFYDGKSTIDITEEEMPYKHVVQKIRFNVSAPADTVWARLAVTNVYDADHIKSVEDSIQLILLDE